MSRWIEAQIPEPRSFQISAASPVSPWLHRFAVFTAISTLGLIIIGGLVTSHGAGMAVPDWPNSYGYTMFAFPFSKWRVGGILYEHSHRLVATFVGLLTAVLTLWLWVRETRGRGRWLGVGAIVMVLGLMGIRALPVYITLACLALVVGGFSLYQIKNNFAALRWWGALAFAAVILQGVLGGLRVVWLKDQIGIFHAALAQMFFALTCLIALFTSRWGRGLGVEEKRENRQRTDAIQNVFAWLLPATALLIFAQLILGATMRHQHAGLAIPDFPLAYGKVWPSMDAASVTHYNQQRQEITAVNPITAIQIGLQMAHRIMALLICGAVAFCAWSARRKLGASHPVSKLTLAWFGLILTQALLGAATIWSDKAADVATAHVMVSAMALALGAIVSIVASRSLVLARGVPAAEAQVLSPFGLQPSAHTGLK